MPRLHDYTKSSGYETVPVSDPRFGLNEIGVEQLNAEFAIFPPAFGRKYQFSASWSDPIEEFQASMDQAFEWLSNNTTGPWSWHEEWGNHGHSLGIFLHIERASDQAVFNRTWGHAFEYRPDETHDLDNLAVLKGVLPRKKQLFSWLSDNGLQYDMNYFEVDEAGEKDRKILISADTGEKAALFKEHWGHLFHSYIRGTVSDETASGNRFLETRKDTQIFIGDWYIAPDRPIPEDFMNYLEGRCDFSAVRTIQPETPPTGLLQRDFACK